jgi:hypothetical protein
LRIPLSYPLSAILTAILTAILATIPEKFTVEKSGFINDASWLVTVKQALAKSSLEPNLFAVNIKRIEGVAHFIRNMAEQLINGGTITVKFFSLEFNDIPSDADRLKSLWQIGFLSVLHDFYVHRGYKV